MNTQERFDYYLERFTRANTPEDKQKVIVEYTDVCFSDTERDLGRSSPDGQL